MGFVSGKIPTNSDEFRHSSTRSISIFQTANRHYINAVLSAVSVITNTYNHHQKSRAFHFYNKFFGVLAINFSAFWRMPWRTPRCRALKK